MADDSTSPVDSQDGGPPVQPPIDNGPYQVQATQLSTVTQNPPVDGLIMSESSATDVSGSIQRQTGTPVIETLFLSTDPASIAPDQPPGTITGSPSRPTGSPVGNFGIDETGGPSHGQVVAAIVVPTLLVSFFLIALAMCVFRRKRRRLQHANENRSKEMGSFYSPQQGSSVYQLPRRPTTAAKPPVLPALDTQFFGSSLSNQRGMQDFHPSIEEHVQSAGHRGIISDPPPPYLPRTGTDLVSDSVIRYEPSHLTQTALTQRHPPDHNSPFDDDAISQVSADLDHRGDSDNFSVVSDVSYHGQGPVVEHHML